MIGIDNDDKDCIIEAYKQRQQQRKETTMDIITITMLSAIIIPIIIIGVSDAKRYPWGK